MSQVRTLDRKEQLKRKRRYWVLRRIQDVFFSSVAMVVLLPLMLLIALAVVIDDPHGGPLFGQTRCGRDGKPFRMYKFRSMYTDAESRLEEVIGHNEKDGPAFKMKNDPRITRVGRIIRKTSVDELPQLWNIIKGDMSIVGPRPPLPKEVAQYTAHQKQRLYVTPGLTCYWQVQPNRDDISFEEWVDMDLKYIEERNFWVDWKIIFMTLRSVFLGQGR